MNPFRSAATTINDLKEAELWTYQSDFNTDPELVYLQLDTYWMYRGGQDPIEWMRRFSHRVILLHQRTFRRTHRSLSNLFDDVVSPTENIDDALFTNRKDPRCFTEIGTGVLPIQDLLDAASKLPKLDYLFLGTGPHRPAGDRVDPTQQRRIFRQVHRHFLALSQAAILRRADP